MSEWEEKLNTLLSDPDAMAQVMNMAQNLSQQMGQSGGSAPPPPPAGGAAGPTPSAPPPPPPQGDPMGDLSSLLGGIDPGMIAKLLPVLSQLCLTRCNREETDDRPAITADSGRYRTALGSLVSLIVASLVLSCLFGYVWQMTVASVDSAYEAHRLPLIANIVAAVKKAIARK